MIDTGSKSGEEIGEEGRMFLEIKVESFVINFKIGRLDNNLFEGIMFLSLKLNWEEGIPMRRQNVPSSQGQHYQTRRSECRA